MKTRIIWTEIWDDEFFSELPITSQFLFLYLITNSKLNISGIYKLPDRVITFHTRLEGKDLQMSKKSLEPKVYFCEGWVYVVNARMYGMYKGEKNDIAYKREMELIPNNIKESFVKGKSYRVSGFDDTLPIPLKSKSISKSESKSKSRTGELRKKAHELIGKPI